MNTQYTVGYSVNVNAGTSVETLDKLSKAFTNLQKASQIFSNAKNDDYFDKLHQNIGKLNAAVTSFGATDKNFNKRQFNQRLDNFSKLTAAFNQIAQQTSSLDPNKLRGFTSVTNSVAKAMQTISSIQGSSNVGVAVANFAESFGAITSMFNRVKDLSLNGAGSKVMSMTNTVAKAMTVLGSTNISKSSLKNARNAMGVLNDYNKLLASGNSLFQTSKPARSYAASLNSMTNAITKLGGADMQGAFRNITKMFGKLNGMNKQGSFEIMVDNSMALASINEVIRAAWTLRRVLQETNVLSTKIASATGMSSGVKNVGPQRNQVGFIKTNTNKGPTDSYAAMPYMGKKSPKVGGGPTRFSTGIQNISTGFSGPMSWAQYKSTLSYPTGFGVGQEQRYQAWAKWARGGAMKYPEFMSYVNENATLQGWYSRLVRENTTSRMVKTTNTPPYRGLLPSGTIPLDYSRLVQASGMRFNDFKKLYPFVAREEVLRYWRTAQATMKATPRSTATTPYSAPIGLLPSPTETTKFQTASQMRFNEWRKLYPAMPRNGALNYWHSARAAANVSSANPIAMGSAPSAASSTAKAKTATIIPPFQKTAGKYGARGSIIPRNVGYKVLGPSMLDSGGLGIASLLQGMGVMYGVTGAFSMFGKALADYTEYNNIMQTAMNILHAHDTGTNFYGRFGGMANTVRRVGVETKFTAPQVADAAKFLAMAGYNINDINNSIRPIADIALVGDTELGTTADLVTNVMTAYKIKPNQLRQAADIMTNTFTMSNTTLTEMAEAYKYSAGLLANNGVSFQESAAALGILGNAGIKGSQAGTTMRTIIANLLNPTENKQLVEWERLGIKRKDKNGNLRDLVDIFRDLANSKKKVNVYKIFHKTAAQGAAALIDQVDRWNEIIAQNFLSDGMVSKLAEAKKNTISGLWAQLTSMFTEDAIRSFEGVNGTIVDFLKSGINALDPNNKSGGAESIRRTITQIVGLLENVKDISAAIFKTWEHIGGFVTTFWKIQMIAAPLLFGLRSVKSLFNMGAGAMAMAGSIGNFAGGVGTTVGRLFGGESRVKHQGGRSVYSGMFGMPGVSRNRYAMPGISNREMYWNGYTLRNSSWYAVPFQKPVRAMSPSDWQSSAFQHDQHSKPLFTAYAQNPTKKNAQAYWAYRNSAADPSSGKRSSHISHLRALSARRQTLMPAFGGFGGMLGMGLGGWGGSELAMSMGAEQGGLGQMVGSLAGAAAGTVVGTKALGALGNVVAFAPWVGGILAASALAGWGIYKLYKAHRDTKKFTQENIEWTKQMYGDVSMIGLDSSKQMNKYLKVLNDSQSSLNTKTENYIKLLKEQFGLTPKTDNLNGLPLSQIDPDAYNKAKAMDENRTSWWLSTPYKYLSQSLAVDKDNITYDKANNTYTVKNAYKGSFAERMSWNASSRRATVKNVLTNGSTTFDDPGAAALAWDVGMNRSGNVFGPQFNQQFTELLKSYESGDFEGANARLFSSLQGMYDASDPETQKYSVKDYLNSTNIGKNRAAILGYTAGWWNILTNKEDIWYKQIEAVKALRKSLKEGYDYGKPMPDDTMAAMNNLFGALGMMRDEKGNVFSLDNPAFKDMPYNGYFESDSQENRYRGFMENANAAIAGWNVPWINALFSHMKRTLKDAKNPYFEALKTPYIPLTSKDAYVDTKNGRYLYVPSKNLYIKDKYVEQDSDGRFKIKDGKDKQAMLKGNHYDYQEAQRLRSLQEQLEIRNAIESASGEIPGSEEDDYLTFNWQDAFKGFNNDQSDFQSATQRQISGIAEKPTYATNTVTYQPGAYQININGVPLSVSEAKDYSEPIAQIGHYLLGVAGVEDRTFS